MIKIQGLEKLTKQLREAERAFAELQGEMEFRFDPNDQSSVEIAIAEMKAAINAKAAPFASNPLVAPLIEKLKLRFEHQILDIASQKKGGVVTSNGAIDPQILRNIENAVNDLRRADYRSFDRHIKKLSRLLHSPELDPISSKLKGAIDLDAWIQQGQATQGGMIGSAQLTWPDTHEAELGIVIALTDRFADDDGKPTATDFSFQFYYSQNNYTQNLQHMVSEIYVPFARDFINYVKASTGVHEATLLPPKAPNPNSRKIFVVHGHDEGAREATARFLETLGFETIILNERPSQGRTIIEKIEDHGDVGFAVVLLTGDDVGARRGEEANLKPRARQNVLLELGYFVGRLGRSRVVALKRGDIEIPSDFDGVVYVPYDNGNGWKQVLGQELAAAGYEIDWNKVMQRRP